MGSFGERLQREREMRGITLEEIAEATKIGTRSLRALEEQDFDKLPGGVFNRGFVRAYSKYLGIDEDQAVADYQAAVNEAQTSGKLVRPEHTMPTIVDAEVENKEPVRIPWGLLILIALVVVVAFSARSYYAQHGWAKLRRQSTPQTKPAQSQEQAVAQQPLASLPAANTPDPAPKQSSAAAATTSLPSNPAKAVAIADGFTVKVHAKEDAWIEITADGRQVFSELMKANSDKTVHAQKTLQLVTGNAGGVEIAQNDKALPSLGKTGEKRTVVLTPQGIQQ